MAQADSVGAPRSSDPNPLSLLDALSLAEDNYPSVRAALADRAAADGDIATERTAYLPQVNLLAQINRATVNNITGLLLPQAVIPSISGPVTPETGRSSWNSGVGVLASWRPFDFGYRAARVAAAGSAADAADQATQLTRLDVAAATSDAFLNLIAAQALADTAQANLDRLKSFASAAHILVDNKLRAGVEAQQADAAVALAQTTLISTRNNIVAQRATLARLVGRPLERLSIDGSFAATLPTTDLATATASENHPALRQADARIDQRRAELRAIGRSVAPQIDLVGSASARGSGRTAIGGYQDGTSGLSPDVGNWAAGVQLSIPLGSIPRVRAESAAQRARVDAAQARRDQVAVELEERIVRARADLASAREIAAVTPVAAQASRTSEEQQRVRFQHGLASAVEVAAAQAALAQAESQNAIARINVWRALAALAIAQGNIASFEQLLRSRG